MLCLFCFMVYNISFDVSVPLSISVCDFVLCVFVFVDMYECDFVICFPHYTFCACGGFLCFLLLSRPPRHYSFCFSLYILFLIIHFCSPQAVVDGDLCEQFSAIDYAKQKTIAGDLARGPNDVAKRLEEIRNRVL